MNVAIIVRPDEPPQVREYAAEIKMELGFMFCKAAVLSGPTAAGVWLEKHSPGALLFVTDDAYPLGGYYRGLIDEAARRIPGTIIGIVAFDDTYKDFEYHIDPIRLQHRSKVFSGQYVARFLS